MLDGNFRSIEHRLPKEADTEALGPSPHLSLMNTSEQDCEKRNRSLLWLVNPSSSFMVTLCGNCVYRKSPFSGKIGTFIIIIPISQSKINGFNI